MDRAWVGCFAAATLLAANAMRRTLVERTSRLLILMLIKMPEFKPASAGNVMQAFAVKFSGLAEPLCQSMTYNQGRERAMHKS